MAVATQNTFWSRLLIEWWRWQEDPIKVFPLYNKILNYWFPPTKDYDTSPKWSIPDSRKTTNFIAFVTEHHQHPFLLVEIKPPSDFQLDLRHGAAISQVIQCLDEIGAKQSAYADWLYAISAIGKRWRACYTLKGKGSKGVTKVNSLRSANQECWNPDITYIKCFLGSSSEHCWDNQRLYYLVM